MQRFIISVVRGTFDLITANLDSLTLIRTVPEIAPRLHSGGLPILSGILIEQEDEILKAIQDAGLSLAERVVEGEWVTLLVIQAGK